MPLGWTPAEDTHRRLMLVRLPLWAVESLAKEGSPDTYVRCTKGAVPSDATLVRVFVLPERDELVLTYQHETFPVMPAWTDCLDSFQHVTHTPSPYFTTVHVTAADLKFLADNPEWKREKSVEIPQGPWTQAQTNVGNPDAPHVVGGT